MATRAAFLTQSYGAYDHRDAPQEDEELTHVGPGTFGGEYLRRSWQLWRSPNGYTICLCACASSVRLPQ
jgi:hypothetical protein